MTFIYVENYKFMKTLTNKNQRVFIIIIINNIFKCKNYNILCYKNCKIYYNIQKKRNEYKIKN